MASSTEITLILLFVGISVCQASDNNLTLYHGSLDNYTSVEVDNATDLLPLMDLNLTTCFYIFGIDNNATSAARPLQALLDKGNCNVILLDWSKGAKDIELLLVISYVFVNVPSVEKVGPEFGEAILKLIDGGMDLSKFFIAGHSAGAQIAGVAGRYTKKNNVTVPKIIAMDPAGPLFETILPINPTVDTDCADFVEIIHTDPDFLSYREATGHVDYYPNYNPIHTVQPGCSWSISDLTNLTKLSDKVTCNHGYAVKLFTACLLYPDELQAEKAKSGVSWLTGKGNSSDVSTISVTPTPGASGRYYLKTVEDYPYGLGLKGISPK